MKAVFLDRDKVIERFQTVSQEAFSAFREIKEVRLFGSLARKEETGLSDIDILLIVDSEEKNPVERMKPCFSFFADRMDIAVDMIVATGHEMDNHKEILKDSILICSRGI